MAVVDRAMDRAQKAHRDVESGQHGLFGVFQQEESRTNGNEKLPDIPDWDEPQRLAAEKEILGFFITGHPLDSYADKLLDLGIVETSAICQMKQGTGKDEVSAAGMIGGIRVQKSRKGEMYAQATLEDMTGKVDVLVFPEAYRRLAEQLKIEVPVLVRGA